MHVHTKCIIKISRWIVLVALFSCMKIHAANEIILTDSGSTRLKVIESTQVRLKISNTLSSFKTTLRHTENEDFVELTVDSYSKNNKIGAPQLPVLSKLIEIPEGSNPEVKVISYDVKDYKLADWGITHKLFPVQTPQSKNSNRVTPFDMDKQIYTANSFYGEALARIEVAGFMRGVHLANLVLSPVEYNPVSNTMRVYDNLIVEVNFSGAGRFKSQEHNSGKQSPYFKSVFRNALNHQPEGETAAELPGIPVKFVIVSDLMFKSALQPFIHWKTKRGFKVIEAYTDDPAVGKSSSSIKAYLQNLYTSATEEDPAPTFVLFVGDVDQIPAFDCGDHVSDLYYCEYTGDYLPEVFYGRFSANTVGELLPQIDKTLQYEQYLMPDPSFLNQVVIAAGADAMHQLRWGNGQANYATTNYFNTAHNLVPYTYLQPEPTGSNYSENMRNNISNGVSYAYYSAHGNPEGWADPSFTISDIAKLTNAGKYGLIIGNCCETNVYNKNTFGEALLRAENKGALGYIGSSGLSYWDEDYWWSVGNGSIVSNPTFENTGPGVYDRIFHDHGESRSEWYSTMGQMVFAGNLAVQSSNSGMKKFYWETYCLMGDPSTMIYFGVPAALTVNHAPLLPMQSSTFEVRTEPYASVAISKNNMLNGVAIADEYGLAKVSLKPFSEPGYAYIVVTMQNRQPYIDSVKVETPEGAFLVLKNVKINDADGNGNSLPESGELLTATINLSNPGNSGAATAKSVLSTNDSYFIILDSTYVWPAIPANGSATAENAFTLQTSNDVPDMHNASFTLKTKVDSATFSSEFSFLVYAPKLINGTMRFDDSTAGNDNGRIDPGETIFITLPVTNSGHSTSADVITQLFLFGDIVTTDLSTHKLGNLLPGETGYSTFAFKVAPDVALGSVFSIYIMATSGSYNSVTSRNLVIGLRIEDFETGNFHKFKWQFKGEKPWQVSSAVKYESSYSAKSGALNDLEKSEMFMEGQVLFNDTISFYRKVSSETGYDFLRFYVDDHELGKWSGNKDWAKVSFPVSAGNHRFRWVYEKDEATIAGLDAAWIDYIQLPSFSQSDLDAGSVKTVAVPATICAGEQSQLYVFASGDQSACTFNWEPASSLNQSSIFNPFASPNETTTYNISAGNAKLFATGKVTVTVVPVPETPVISISDNELISSELFGNQWYNSNGLIPGAIQQKYLPELPDTYFVIANNAKGCPSSASNLITLNFTDIKTSVENNFRAYPNPFTNKLFIDYYLKSAGQVKIILYNSLGSEIETIKESEKTAGNHKAFFDGGNLATGLYLCKIFNPDGVWFAKVIKNEK